MIDSGHLVLGNELFEDSLVDVIALQGLSNLSPARNIPTVFEDCVKEGHVWNVFIVSKCVTRFDALILQHIVVNEEICKALIQRH